MAHAQNCVVISTAALRILVSMPGAPNDVSTDPPGNRWGGLQPPAPPSRLRRVVLWSALIAALAAGGVAVAGYQTWMQAFPELATECGYAEPNLIERLVDWLGMQWPSMFLATGFCTSKEWVFLSLSMANWSMLIFAGIAVYAMFFLGRRA